MWFSQLQREMRLISNNLGYHYDTIIQNMDESWDNFVHSFCVCLVVYPYSRIPKVLLSVLNPKSADIVQVIWNSWNVLLIFHERLFILFIYYLLFYVPYFLLHHDNWVFSMSCVLSIQNFLHVQSKLCIALSSKNWYHLEVPTNITRNNFGYISKWRNPSFLHGTL